MTYWDVAWAERNQTHKAKRDGEILHFVLRTCSE
jgi:hypothetical protein